MKVFPFGSGGQRISLHVGSGGVSGVCVKEDPHGTVTIVHGHRSDVPIREHVQAQTLEQHTSEAIERVLTNIHTSVKGHTARVDVVLTSPWFSAHTKNILIEHKEPFFVTKKLIDDVIAKEIAMLKKATSGQDVVVEQKVTRIRLNGYETNDPYSKKVTQCEISLFVSFAAQSFVTKITAAIQKIISPHRIAFHSFPYVSFSVMSRIWHTDHYFAYVDVGAEVTEVMCSNGGALSESFSFPLGTNHIVRAIAKKRETPHELALSMLSLYGRGAADGETSVSIDSIFSPLREEWVAYIDQIIRDSGGDHAIVQKMYVSADEPALSLWTTALASRAQQVVPLTSSMLAPFVHASAHTTIDTLSLLESMFVDNPQSAQHLHE